MEDARLKLAKEQKKRGDMEAAARLAAQRRTTEQAARQQVEADMQKKRADRQSRVGCASSVTSPLIIALGLDTRLDLRARVWLQGCSSHSCL